MVLVNWYGLFDLATPHKASIIIIWPVAFLCLPFCHLPHTVPKVEKKLVFVEAKEYFQLFKILIT